MFKNKFSGFLKAVFAIVILIILGISLVFSQRFLLKNAYPIKYKEYVLKYCDEYSLDPYFVFSVVRTESDFYPQSTSSVNARGLMQVTEVTFDWIRKKLSDNESTFDDMYDPETSIRYGVFFISYLSERLKSEQNILCGYHAGLSRAKIWINDETISENGLIVIDNIPYKDTKQYVNKVMKTYNIYKKLYKKSGVN